jgi:hypothetical protein
MALSTISGVGAGSSGTILTTTNPKTGNVIQVVSASSTTADTTSSTSAVATSLSLSITPTYSTSKIFLLSTATVGMGTPNVGRFWFARNGTVINEGGQGWGASYYISNSSYTNSGYPWSETWVDSPGTTSAITYAIYFAVDSGGPACFNTRGTSTNSGRSVIVAMEIAG